MFKWWFASWQYMRVHKTFVCDVGHPDWVHIGCEVETKYQVLTFSFPGYLRLRDDTFILRTYLNHLSTKSTSQRKSTGSSSSGSNCWAQVSAVAATVDGRDWEPKLRQVLPTKLLATCCTEDHWGTLRNARDCRVAILESPDCEHEHNSRETASGRLPFHICRG